MLIWCDAQWLVGEHAYTEGLGEKEQQALAAMAGTLCMLGVFAEQR